MNIHTYIKEAREKRKLSQRQLAMYAELSNATISRIESGSASPDPDSLTKLAKALHVDPTILYELCGYLPPPALAPSSTNPDKGVWINVLGSIAAGIPLEAIEDIVDQEEIPLDMASQGVYFGLRIMGNSMEPIINNGDVVIVRQQECVDTGDIAVVLVNGNDATVKRIKRRPEGIMLIPANPTHEPMFYTNEEIAALPISVLGKVVELRRKF